MTCKPLAISIKVQLIPLRGIDVRQRTPFMWVSGVPGYRVLAASRTRFSPGAFFKGARAHSRPGEIPGHRCQPHTLVRLFAGFKDASSQPVPGPSHRCRPQALVGANANLQITLCSFPRVAEVESRDYRSFRKWLKASSNWDPPSMHQEVVRV